MALTFQSRIPEVLRKHERRLIEDWLKEQVSLLRKRNVKEADVREESAEFIAALMEAMQGDGSADVSGDRWKQVRDILSRISRSRGNQGFSPSETATFVFSFKKQLFEVLRGEYAGDAARLADEIWYATEILDSLGLFTTEVYQKAREEVISRQQQELLELSTPVVQLWQGVLALPLIGTLDSARTQVVMESLLQRIVETGSMMAIIDITGVPTVDTLVAQHLLKTVTASRLMGADCIISGIRPQIAQTIVHLGVTLKDVTTKANLSDAFQLALERQGMKIVRRDGTRGEERE